jgi:hypothetical protein
LLADEPPVKRPKVMDANVYFWKELCEKIGYMLNSNSRIIESPTDSWILMLSKCLYVRDAYIEELKEFKKMRDKFLTKDANSNKPLFYYIGTSGLGKSSYLAYVLASLLRERFENDNQHITFRLATKNGDEVSDYYLVSNGDVSIYNSENVDYYLSDSKDISEKDVKSVYCGLILVTSIKSEEMDRFSKLTHQKVSRTMPTWSLDELKYISPHFTEDEQKLRYSVFGGSPRNFLNTDLVHSKGTRFDYVDEVMSLFRENCEEKDKILASLSTIVKEKLALIANKDKGEVKSNNLSSLMRHSNDGKEHFWASKFMEFIGGEILEKEQDDIKVTLVNMVGRTGFGCYFEYRGHRALIQSERTYTLHALHQGVKPVKWVLNKPVLKRFHSIEDIKSLNDGEYGLPYSSTFPLVDAVIQPDTLVQFTSSSKHDGAKNRLSEIRSMLHEKKKEKHRMIFVVNNIEDFNKVDGLDDIRQFKTSYTSV